jgi:hypothetical protein
MRQYFYVLFLTFFLISAKYIGFSDIAKIISGKSPDKIVEFLILLRNIFTVSKYDKNAEEFHEFLSNSFENFDFKALFNSKYMEKTGEDSRWVTYSGKYNPNYYYISLINIPFETIPNPDFGDYSAYFGLKRKESSSYQSPTYPKLPSYLMNLKVNSNFGNISHETGSLLLEQLLRVIDPTNLKDMESGESKRYPKLKKPNERKIIYQLEKDFPKLLQFLNSYTTSSSLLAQEAENNAYTKMQFAGELNQKTIRVKYPYLGDYLDNLKDLGWIKLELILPTGQKILEAGLSSEKLQLTAKLFTKNGKIIPYTISGKLENLDFKNEIALTTVNKLDYKINIQFHGNIFGLEFDSKSILLNAVYTKKPNEGKIKIQFSKFDKIHVSGGFSYVIPVWLINFVIPGNLEDLANHFAFVVQKANAGKGSVAEFTWTNKNKNWEFNSELNTEIIDNFFIRFGLRIWNNKFLPTTEAREELGKFIYKAIDSLIQDFPK